MECYVFANVCVDKNALFHPFYLRVWKISANFAADLKFMS